MLLRNEHETEDAAQQTLTAENSTLRLLLEQAGIDAKALLAQAGIDARERETADEVAQRGAGPSRPLTYHPR